MRSDATEVMRRRTTTTTTGFRVGKTETKYKKKYINKTLLIIIYTYVQYTDKRGREDSRSYNMRVLYYYYIHIYYNICTYTHIVHDR